jgi:P27 family predicted phage terminase small subunit
MGKRGNPPIPTTLKLLRGETREERLNRDAPRPSGGPPVMPAGMSKEAQKVWRRQLKALGGTGILTTADTDCFRVFCEAVVRYVEAAKLLAVSGPLTEGQRGTIKNPLHQVVRDNAGLVRQFARELGFLPTAREGLHTREGTEGDPLEEWIARGR